MEERAQGPLGLSVKGMVMERMRRTERVINLRDELRFLNSGLAGCKLPVGAEFKMEIT
jgi:hypothetical protein